MYIIGAGYTGLIAGVLFPQATILEAAPQANLNHTALLRFRTPTIGDVTHIPFHKVPVMKTIWCYGTERSPSPRYSNLYSKKVTGEFVARSIQNIDPCERYIAPDDFYQKLLDLCWDRIKWGSVVNYIDSDRIVVGSEEHDRSKVPVVSTIPLKIACRATSTPFNAHFSHKPIHTYRVKLKTPSFCFYTAYYPHTGFPAYRASITRDVLIIECIAGAELEVGHLIEICNSFGMDIADLDFDPSAELKQVEQKYGKIAPIDEKERQRLIYELTVKHNIFTLGRFGTWRNILLDDVYGDILKIKRLINLTPYEIRLEL